MWVALQVVSWSPVTLPRKAAMADDDEPPSRRGAVVAMAVIIILLLGTAYVSYRLRDAGRMQDCLAAGRANCAPVESPSR